MGDHLVARPLPKHRITQTQNKHIHMPCVETCELTMYLATQSKHIASCWFIALNPVNKQTVVCDIYYKFPFHSVELYLSWKATSHSAC
jgi:hypothetical protein